MVFFYEVKKKKTRSLNGTKVICVKHEELFAGDSHIKTYHRLRLTHIYVYIIHIYVLLLITRLPSTSLRDLCGRAGDACMGNAPTKEKKDGSLNQHKYLQSEEGFSTIKSSRFFLFVLMTGEKEQRGGGGGGGGGGRCLAFLISHDFCSLLYVGLFFVSLLLFYYASKLQTRVASHFC